MCNFGNYKIKDLERMLIYFGVDEYFIVNYFVINLRYFCC